MKHSVFIPPYNEFDKVGPIVDANAAKLDDLEQIPTFFDQSGDALVLPREVYNQQRSHLSTNVTVLAEEQQFLRMHEQIVLIGRSTEVARGTVHDRSL